LRKLNEKVEGRQAHSRDRNKTWAVFEGIGVTGPSKGRVSNFTASNYRRTL
jgi:hypothetical protein